MMIQYPVQIQIKFDFQGNEIIHILHIVLPSKFKMLTFNSFADLLRFSLNHFQGIRMKYNHLQDVDTNIVNIYLTTLILCLHLYAYQDNPYVGSSSNYL